MATRNGFGHDGCFPVESVTLQGDNSDGETTTKMQVELDVQIFSNNDAKSCGC